MSGIESVFARAVLDSRGNPTVEAEVVLEDHYTGAEINAAVGRGETFSDAFPGETRGELDALRALFQRKALVARQAALFSQVADPATATLGELTGPAAERCRELRRALGLTDT